MNCMMWSGIMWHIDLVLCNDTAQDINISFHNLAAWISWHHAKQMWHEPGKSPVYFW